MPLFVVMKKINYLGQDRELIVQVESNNPESAEREVLDAWNMGSLWNSIPPGMLLVQDDYDDNWYDDEVPKGGWSVTPYDAVFKENGFFPVGTKVFSILGESGDANHGQDQSTGTNATGVITEVLPGQEHCYGIDFPTGISVFLCKADLEDKEKYRILTLPEPIQEPRLDEYKEGHLIVIHLEGGVIQSILGDTNSDIQVCIMDTDDTDSGDDVFIGKDGTRFYGYLEKPDFNPEKVGQVFLACGLKQTPEQLRGQKYLNDLGANCLVCGSDNLEMDNPRGIENDVCTCNVSCNSCESKWTNCYSHTGYWDLALS
jgi:hypothetical protein